MIRFTYCAYWRTWSRLDKVVDGQYHETNLIPVKTSTGIDWNDCGKVRVHRTAMGKGDFTTGIEPEGLRDTLIQNVGIEKTEELIGKGV